MIVLSLFGGMECGRITLDKMGVTPSRYYSSEVDKFAIAEVTANYPDVIHLGDVTRWREWDIPWGDIDLVIGGSPCQGFSFAGKQLAFDDPRSALFFEYVNILNHVRFMNKVFRGREPWFMLENVRMKRDHLDVITDYLGVEPVFINSALVCAQNRQRYYWCNWSVPQPEDRGILLADILESDGVGVVRNRGVWREVMSDKSTCLVANYYKGMDNHAMRTCVMDNFNVNSAAMVGRKIDPLTGKRNDYSNSIKTEQYLEVSDSGKSRCLSTVAKDTLISNMPPGRYKVSSGVSFRMLTVTECCRLQGVPDDYFKVSSNTQAYKMLGNGWQVDTIEHIFNHCPLFSGGSQ